VPGTQAALRRVGEVLCGRFGPATSAGQRPASGAPLQRGLRRGFGGCGKGEDAATLSHGERRRYRKDALDWLRVQLALWDREQAQGATAARERVHAKLRHWQKDPDLAGVREPAALAELSHEERAALLTFWADVAATLDRGGVRK
jgi:hypothetical protein